MRLELSSFVAGDLAVIADYIAEDNPARALSFIKELRARIREVAKRPEIYQVRPEIGAEARLALFGRYVILSHRREGCSSGKGRLRKPRSCGPA